MTDTDIDTSLADLRHLLKDHGLCSSYYAGATAGASSPEYDPWHPEIPRGRNARACQRALARKACSGCPVASECLVLALIYEHDAGASWGWWGGTIPEDRRDMLRALDLATAPDADREACRTVVEEAVAMTTEYRHHPLNNAA